MLVRQTGDVRHVGAVWTVVAVIQPPSPLQVIHLEKNLKGIFKIAEKRYGKEGTLLWTRRWKVLKNMLRLEESRLNPATSTLEEQLSIVNRVERALLGFVGTIFRPLFNIPDFTDIKALQDMILKNSARHDGMAHHITQMVSWINATRELVKQNDLHISQVQFQTRQTWKSLNSTQQQLEAQNQLIAAVKLSRTIDNTLHDIEVAVSNHIDTLKNFHNQKMDLERGWLTENILSVRDLSHC